MKGSTHISGKHVKVTQNYVDMVPLLRPSRQVAEHMSSPASSPGSVAVRRLRIRWCANLVFEFHDQR